MAIPRGVKHQWGRVLSRYWSRLTYTHPVHLHVHDDATAAHADDTDALTTPLGLPHLPWRVFLRLFDIPRYPDPWFLRRLSVLSGASHPYWPQFLVGVVGGVLRPRNAQLAHHARRRLDTLPWSGQPTHEVKFNSRAMSYTLVPVGWRPYTAGRILALSTAKRRRRADLDIASLYGVYTAANQRARLRQTLVSELREDHQDLLNRNRVVARNQAELRKLAALIETSALELRRHARDKLVLGDRVPEIQKAVDEEFNL